MNKLSFFTQSFMRTSLAAYAALFILTACAATLVSGNQAHAAVGDACSFSADGKTYSGTVTDLQSVNFCNATSSVANVVTAGATGALDAAIAATSDGSSSSNGSCKRSATTGTNLNSYIDNCGGTQEIRVTKTTVKQDKGVKPPAIVFVHGGGWFSDDGNFSPAFQARAAKWGFTSFRIKYRLMPGGINEQYQDVQRAINHVRSNADKYGIDKNRIAVWGDSAGGSLAVRVAASGKSGVKAAVGWSAPTNGFRDMFNSYDGWVAGMYHSRCFGSLIPASVNDIITSFASGDVTAIAAKIAEGKILTPQESTKILNLGLRVANLTLTELPTAAGKLQVSEKGIGYTLTPSANSTSTPKTTTPALTKEQIKQDLANLTPTELTAIGVALYQFSRTAQGITSEDETTTETISLITSSANLLTQIQREVQQEKATSGTGADMSATASAAVSAAEKASAIATIFSTSNIADATSLINADSPIGASQAIINLADNASNALGINPQQLPAKKIAECMADFMEMSPALFASPRSPRMYLVSGAQERWVNPLDSYQMRDKLRSMGISSDALVLPQTTKQIVRTNADGHMGYDQRAEVPSFQYLHDVLKSKTAS